MESIFRSWQFMIFIKKANICRDREGVLPPRRAPYVSIFCILLTRKSILVSIDKCISEVKMFLRKTQMILLLILLGMEACVASHLYKNDFLDRGFKDDFFVRRKVCSVRDIYNFLPPHYAKETTCTLGDIYLMVPLLRRCGVGYRLFVTSTGDLCFVCNVRGLSKWLDWVNFFEE